jgi:hypothetical protein
MCIADQEEGALAMKDLAPMIYRQRLVLEGTCSARIEAGAIEGYLEGLSRVCDMDVLLPPVTHRSDRYGWAGWVHWEASGAHVYAWEQPLLFFSVDIYTCKQFDVDPVVRFTELYFGADQIVAREF